MAIVSPIEVPVYPSVILPSRASKYDGANDFELRGGDFTGNIDDPKGIMSGWLCLDGGDGLGLRVYESGGSYIQFARTGGNVVQFFARNAAGATILQMQSTTTLKTDTIFHHAIGAWDLATPGASWLRIDDADVKNLITFTNDTIDYTRPDHAIGAQTGGSAKWNGKISKLYINFGEYLADTTANHRKFISAAGRPVYLGYNGARPTGNQPIGWFPDGGPRNLGYGGDFTVTGALERVGGP